MKPHCQQVLFETRFDRKIKTLTNSRSLQCFDFLDLSSFRFIYYPHCLANYAFSYNLVTVDFNKICVCRRINVQSRVKRVLEATLKHVNQKPTYLYAKTFGINLPVCNHTHCQLTSLYAKTQIIHLISYCIKRS